MFLDLFGGLDGIRDVWLEKEKHTWIMKIEMTQRVELMRL